MILEFSLGNVKCEVNFLCVKARFKIRHIFVLIFKCKVVTVLHSERLFQIYSVMIYPSNSPSEL